MRLPATAMLAALLLSACNAAKQPGDHSPASTESHSPAIAPTPVAPAIDPALLGQWQPYDTQAFKVLGALAVKPDRLDFAKGLQLRIVPASPLLARVDPADGARPVWGKDGLCGAVPVRAVSFILAEPKVLRISVHDVASGPGPDADFDLHRCQTFTYVRD
ncbi:MAG: hypothetical protein ACK4G2_01795 [Novosphingobium sp.]